MRVLAVDPGNQTGWAVGELDIDVFDVRVSGVMTSWSKLKEVIEENEPLLVLFETFRIFPSKARGLVGDELEAVQTIGVLKYLCLEKKLTLLGRQPSLKSVPIIPRDAWVKELIRSRKTEHERDSIMHLYSYWRTSVAHR